jgi:hypothetical protein
MHRHTFKVPHVNRSVEEWWDAQFDPSDSVIALIKAEIARNGMTDTIHRPVANQKSGEAHPAAQQATAHGEHATLADGSAAPKQADE